MFDQLFWSNSLSNLLATIVGIVIGLPFAFWIDRKARKRNETEKINEAKQRANKILTLLKVELEGNLYAIDSFNKDIANFYYPVGIESWNAFSDGGELQWINDPKLIYELSSVYSQIKHYKFLLEEYFDAFFFPKSMGDYALKEMLLLKVIYTKDTSALQIKTTMILLENKLKTYSSEI